MFKKDLRADVLVGSFFVRIVEAAIGVEKLIWIGVRQNCRERRIVILVWMVG